MPQPKKQAIASRENAVGSFEEFLIKKTGIERERILKLSVKSKELGAPITEQLLAENLIGEEELAKLKGEYFGLPYVDLRQHVVPKEILDLMPESVIANYRFTPFAFDGSILKVAVTDPTDLRALEALDFFAQKKRYIVEIYITSLSGFRHSVSQHKNISSEVTTALEDITKRQKEQATERLRQQEKAPKEERIISEAPISKIVDVILRHAIDERASDIHIEPGEHDMRVRYRIDGVLKNSLVIPKTVHPAIISRIKILSNLKIDEQRLPQDGRFHLQIEKTSVDFRVSTLPTVNGEKVVLRILDKSSGVPSLSDLGISGKKASVIEENLKKSHGMFLVTGPTGSGKSTTLYSVLNKLNRIGVNIVTLEDPVEYYIEGINQSQVKPEIGMTFASGLRSILRQDPNIIMVGEIRDAETGELAVHSALTGHLVFSTLHTNDAVGAIPRLIDMGLDSYLLVASLNVVIAQRLVRRLCSECQKQLTVSAEMEKEMREQLSNVPKDELGEVDISKLKLYQGEGCNACNGTGYKGRIGIYEVLPVSKGIQELMLERASGNKIGELALKEGMITMKQDGYIKAISGVTTISEILRVTKV